MSIIDTPVSLNTTASTSSTSSSSSTDSVQADQDKFLKLLVTQLQNQDPLNPLDNAQVTSQLAQLSTVTGINKLNETLESLKTDYSSTQTLTATNLIGKSVLAAGNGITLSDSASVFGVDLASAAEKVTIEIKNASGTTVRTMTMDNPEAGTYPLTWDGTTDAGGKAADGSYTFKVTATSGGKTLTDATALTLGLVASVSTGAAGVKLNVPAIGQLTLADVKEVL
jgi:flagellar basal-body rod modification protein FlgD